MIAAVTIAAFVMSASAGDSSATWVEDTVFLTRGGTVLLRPEPRVPLGAVRLRASYSKFLGLREVALSFY